MMKSMLKMMPAFVILISAIFKSSAEDYEKKKRRKKVSTHQGEFIRECSEELRIRL